MRVLAATLTFLIALTALGGQAPAAEPAAGWRDPSFLKAAVYVEARLWLLADDGSVLSIDAAAEHRRVETAPGRGLELCVWKGGLGLLAPAAGEKAFVFYTHAAGGQWRRAATLPISGDDAFIGMTCPDSGPLVLTSRRLLSVTFSPAPRVRERPLRGGLRAGLLTRLRATATAVWVGVDAGEWGGGLLRVDRVSGRVETVTQRDPTGELCGGLLNPACDPVNSVEPEPWAPDCVLASVGLEHMLYSGALVEVCPAGIRLLYERPLGEQRRADGKALNTTPFFQMARVGDDIWVAGADGLYRVRGGAVAKVGGYPAFRNVDGVFVSFDNPDFVLAMTAINQRAALSGYTALVAPRKPTE